MVAGGNIHGRDYFCGRYPFGGDGSRVQPGRCWELAVVVLFAFWHDDGFSIRAFVAPFWAVDRCPVRRDALLRQTRCLSARLSRHLPGIADELLNPGLGHKGNDQHRCYDNGYQRD